MVVFGVCFGGVGFGLWVMGWQVVGRFWVVGVFGVGVGKWVMN